MRIGKQNNAFTAIATSDEHSINVRGHDLCRDLIGKIDLTDYFWVLVTGERPTPTQSRITNACLVAIAEHGLVPSVQAARMTLAAGPDAWQGAVSAGLLGMGSVVAGSSEAAGRYLAGLVAAAKESGQDADTLAKESIQTMKARREKVPGLGHPQHSAGDPRANVLLEIAEAEGITSDHIGMLRTVARHAPEIMERSLPINVSGAIPALMLDAGWPLDAMKGVPLLARTAGLVAHLFEESQRSIGFIMSNHADRAISYDGKGATPTSNATGGAVA